MRETMDCGVLLTPGHEITMGHWVARDQPRLARVRLHLVPLRAPGGAPDGPDVHALAGLAVGLARTMTTRQAAAIYQRSAGHLPKPMREDVEKELGLES